MDEKSEKKLGFFEKRRKEWAEVQEEVGITSKRYKYPCPFKSCRSKKRPVGFNSKSELDMHIKSYHGERLREDIKMTADKVKRVFKRK